MQVVEEHDWNDMRVWEGLGVDEQLVQWGGAEDKDAFDILFSRVKTEATTDVKVHAAKMENFLSQFKFNENARMLSVVVHDDLDGQSLFIGHVGILVPSEDGYLFVEKLTFEEPYQAIKFATKEDCYKYLDTKYENYTGEDLAKSFIIWIMISGFNSKNSILGMICLKSGIRSYQPNDS